MHKFLIVEDCTTWAYLISAIIQQAVIDADICYATTLDEAIPQISTVDIVITDYEFPDKGFPALLPVLQKEQRQFILQSANYDCIKSYDPILQLGAIRKGINFTAQMLQLLKNVVAL